MLAAIVNYNMQAVVIFDGFAYPSQHAVPDLRELLSAHLPAAAAAGGGPRNRARARAARLSSRARPLPRHRPQRGGARRLGRGGLHPARVLRARGDARDPPRDPRGDRGPLRHAVLRQPEEIRPAPDRHLPRAARGARQVDLQVELDPRHGRVLRHQPVPRRVLGDDRRPRQPARADRQHQARPGEGGARVRRRPRVLRHQRHVDLQQDRAHGAARARRHRADRPRLPQVAPLRAGARRARSRYYIDAFPLTQYSMYGSLRDPRRSRRRCSRLKAEGKLDRAKMVVLTNCTFDGHVANVLQTMLECLAIKPDLVFLWDEAWFGFARFSPFLRRRTAMGAAAKLREHDARPRLPRALCGVQGAGRRDRPDNEALLDTPLLPDPDKVRVRVYETDSVHKSMSALRQGSIIVVADQDFHTVEPTFQEAFFTHTSTSPNLQIIASLDLARRQMELEGYELVQRAIQLAIELRRDINTHPLISKYFRAATPAEMIPARVPAVRLHRLRRAGLEHREDDRRARRGRVLPRSHAHHAAVRQRRLRRLAVQGAARERVRHPDQQDLAQQRAGADQHQQHEERPRAPHQGAGRHVARDREAPRRGRRRRSARRSRRASSRWSRTCPTCPTSPLPRRVPREPEERPNEGHMRAAFYLAARCRTRAST